MSMIIDSGDVERSTSAPSELFLNAESAAKKFRALVNTGHSKTASVLVFDIYPPELNPDDPNKLLATQLISDLSTPGSELNAKRLLSGSETNKIYDMAKVATYVTTSLGLLLDTPDVQLSTINKTMEANIDWLMKYHKIQIPETFTKATKHPSNYPTEIRRVLERQNRLMEASIELIQYETLETTPNSLLNAAFDTVQQYIKMQKVGLPLTAAALTVDVHPTLPTPERTTVSELVVSLASNKSSGSESMLGRLDRPTQAKALAELNATMKLLSSTPDAQLFVLNNAIATLASNTTEILTKEPLKLINTTANPSSGIETLNALLKTKNKLEAARQELRDWISNNKKTPN